MSSREGRGQTGRLSVSTVNIYYIIAFGLLHFLLFLVVNKSVRSTDTKKSQKMIKMTNFFLLSNLKQFLFADIEFINLLTCTL